MSNKNILIINGKTENEIFQQIIDMHLDDSVMKKVLTSYEKSTGLDSLKKNMSEFFEVK